MPDKFSFQEMRDNAANGLTTLSQEIGEAARSAYCAITQSNPFSVIYDNPLTSGIVKRALSDLCGQDPPGTPPPPFEGGQCRGVRYRVGIKYRIQDGEEIETTRDVYGVVQNVTAEQFQTGWRLCLNAGTQLDPDAARCYSISFINLSENPFNNERISGVTPLDGADDKCGDPPGPGYESEPPPPDIIINRQVNITNNFGDETTYNVKVNRDGDRYVRFPPVLNVNGVSVGIDVTGVSVGDVNITRRSGGGGGRANDPGDSVTQDSEDGVKEPELDETEEEETEGGAEEGIERLVALKVIVVAQPSNAKIVYGRQGPDVIYAGWIEFSNDGFYYPRHYIDFQSQYYPAPDGATGYAVTLKKGYRASIIKVTEKVTEPQ